MSKDSQKGSYVSARTWARRWDCSVSTVRRAARRFAVRRIYVGPGRNGLLRFDLSDIERVERDNGMEAQRVGV